MTRESNRPRRWGTVISKACLVLVGLLFMAPFVWMFFSALKPSNQVLASGTALFGDEIRWDNFTDAFTSIPFGQILINTFAYAIAGSLIVVVVSVLNAYAFARLDFPGRGVLFSVFIATLVLPIEVLVIPLFLGADMLGATDSYPSIILPFAFGAFGTFMLRQFLLSLPGDYEEAARIDGAGQFKILVHVIVPLLRGPIAVVAAFAFIDYWNSFLWPLIIINSAEKAPLQLGLSMFSGERGTDWGPLMAASTIAVLASLVIVVAMQKQLAKGLNLGGFGGR
ncbi:MAG: carbohydrate ABC transporter permease [Propionibacteriaceae bacterium]|nr:carbohydrate ABC transporter permease [Propionibacteriaceae bacterium]